MAKKPKTAALDAALAKRQQRANALFDATLKNIPDLVRGAGPGALDVLGKAYGVGRDYVQSRTPQQVAGDVARGLGTFGDLTARYATDRAQHPLKVLGDAYGLGKDVVTAVPQAASAVGRLSEQAQTLKASDPAAARRLQAGIAMAALGVVPAVGKGKKTAEAVAKAAKEVEPVAKHAAADMPDASALSDRYRPPPELRIYKNPSANTLQTLTEKSPGAYLRGVRHGDEHFWWNAAHGTHGQGAAAAGVPYDSRARLEAFVDDSGQHQIGGGDLGLPPSLTPRGASKIATPAVVSRVSGYEKRLPSLPGIDREKLAEDYPDRLPGEWMADKKTGKPYLGKVLSPEALAVEKHRTLIQKDIKAGNYTPFFNVEDRYHVDPSNYPIVGNTQIDAVPKRPDTLTKYQTMLDTDDARARLMTAYEGSAGNPMAENWYAMGQMEKAYIEELGPEAGREAFRNRFANTMAATTGGADPVSNYLMAKYGNFAQKKGLLLPTAAYDMPYPIGGRFAAGNMAQYEKMINKGAGITASANPKRFNFAANFMGHQDPATMDEVMSNIILPGLKEPPGPSYGVAEKVVLNEAKKLKRPGSRLQDRVWIGDKLLRAPKYNAGPMIQVPNEAITRTARLLGMDPDEVFARMVRDDIPTYAKGGLAKKYGV